MVPHVPQELKIVFGTMDMDNPVMVPVETFQHNTGYRATIKGLCPNISVIHCSDIVIL